MTIFYPDISSYEAGLTIQPGTVAVVAKATEGTYYQDANYADFQAQAARVGAVFSAYHFLTAGNGAAQADYCHAIVGATPVMLDVEPTGNSRPTVADCAAFIARMRQLGGRVWGCYYPRWYWQQTGGDLGSLGVALVASGYPGGYSDTDPNWQPYGGAAPAVWQYTDKQSYGGKSVDFNAFRGTTAELAALINGTSNPSTGGDPMATYTMSDGWQRDYPDVAPQLQQHIPVGAVIDDGNAAAFAMIRSFVAAERAATIEGKLDTLLARPSASPVIDVNALAAALAPHLANGATPDQIAVAVVQHLGADLAKG